MSNLPQILMQPAPASEPFHAGEPQLAAPRAPGVLRRVAAFSLVEVVLALGILSFAFVGLLGLLPVGLNTFRQSVNALVALQITQRVVNEAQQTDFNTFVKNQQAVRYFDDEGNELLNATGAIYYVNVRILPEVTVPGATQTNVNLAEITVQVANNPGNKTLSPGADGLWAATPSTAVINHSTFLAGYRVQ